MEIGNEIGQKIRVYIAYNQFFLDILHCGGFVYTTFITTFCASVVATTTRPATVSKPEIGM